MRRGCLSSWVDFLGGELTLHAVKHLQYVSTSKLWVFLRLMSHPKLRFIRVLHSSMKLTATCCQVLDTEELFVHLAPMLKYHTQQFLRDLWKSFPMATWKETPRGPSRKALALGEGANRAVDDNANESQAAVRGALSL